MKIGIFYATNRNEATVQIINWMQETIKEAGHQAAISRIDENNDFNCDQYIVGTAVYGFSPKRAGIVEFLEVHKKELAKKPTSFFIVCGSDILPNKNEFKGGLIKKKFFYNKLNPHKYLETIVKPTQITPKSKAIFKGYKEPEDKIKNKFDEQKQLVAEWVEKAII